MSVQDGLAVGDFVSQPTNGYVGPPFKLRDSSGGTDDLCSTGLSVAQLSFRNSVGRQLCKHAHKAATLEFLAKLNFPDTASRLT